MLLSGPELRRVLGLGLVVIVAACGASDPPRLVATVLPDAPSPAARADARQASRVQIRNAGGGELLLDGAEAPCGCVVTSALPARLAAGAAATVDLACRAPASGERPARDLRILSSDPAKPEAAITLTLASGGASTDPPALYFGYVALGASTVRDVALPAGVAVDRLPAPPNAALALEPLPVRADGRAAIRVRFTPASAGVLRAYVDLGAAVRPLSIVGVGQPQVVAYPAEIRLAPAGGAREALPPITVKALGEVPVRIASVDYPPGISGELRTVVPGRQYRLALHARNHVPEVGAAIRFLGANAEPVAIVPIVHAGS